MIIDEYQKFIEKSCSEYFQKKLIAKNTLAAKEGVYDDTIKFFLFDQEEKPNYFVSCSNPKKSDLVLRAVERAEKIRAILPPQLAQHIVRYTKKESWKGLWYAVYPYYNPLPKQRLLKFFTRLRISNSLIQWLFDSTKQTLTKIEGEELDKTIAILNQSQTDKVSSVLREHIEQTLENILNKKFIPYHSFCHNDLWEENILLESGKKWNSNFIIIDWAGASEKGYPLYDLLRLNNYTRLSHKNFKKTLIDYAQLIHCKPDQLKFYLTLSLVLIYANLECFPLDDFNHLSIELFDVLHHSLEELY